MTNKTEAPNDLDRAFAKIMAMTPAEMAERVKQYADHPFVKTLRELNQVDDAVNELQRLQDENERQRCSIEALAARRNAMSDRIAQLEAELAKKDDTLVFVERWAVHHGTKPHMTAPEALGIIQHHPHIKAITKSYVDGKLPETYDPYAEIESLKAELITQTNRAASAEQQLTAMTQRWKMANALNTEARAQLAQRQVPADSLLSLESSAHEIFNNPPSCTSQEVRDVIEWYAASVRVALAFPTSQPAAMLAASPTPPQPIKRKPLSDQQIEALRKKTFSTDNPFCPCDSKTMRKAVWAAETAHGIKVADDGK